MTPTLPYPAVWTDGRDEEAGWLGDPEPVMVVGVVSLRDSFGFPTRPGLVAIRSDGEHIADAIQHFRAVGDDTPGQGGVSETAEAFAQGYADRAGVTVDWLREHGREAAPCSCDDDLCGGWQMAHITEARWALDHGCADANDLAVLAFVDSRR